MVYIQLDGLLQFGSCLLPFARSKVSQPQYIVSLGHLHFSGFFLPKLREIIWAAAPLTQYSILPRLDQAIKYARSFGRPPEFLSSTCSIIEDFRTITKGRFTWAPNAGGRGCGFFKKCFGHTSIAQGLISHPHIIVNYRSPSAISRPPL